MLLTLEGLDGSGKTSCWEHLRETLGEEAIFTREPTNSWYGEAVRRSIGDDDADSLAELFLYTADHAAHLADLIHPTLEDGGVVISDRYSDSRYAYQGATLADRCPDAMAFVREIHQPWTRPPDATIYLDVDPETGAERAGVTNKFETVAHLETVQQNYERLIDAEPQRFVRIDATQPQEAVIAEVTEAVETLLDA
jgi:dTMP kinase